VCFLLEYLNVTCKEKKREGKRKEGVGRAQLEKEGERIAFKYI
jgi:hypothetical protein